MVFQPRQEAEELRGWVGWELEKLCTQRKQHTGQGGPELESNSMLWEQWEKIQSMSCGSSSRLRLEAVVPVGHGKQGTDAGQQTSAFTVPALARHQASLFSAKFLSIWAQDDEHTMFFSSPCLKIHLPPYYALDEDETPSSCTWAGASCSLADLFTLFLPSPCALNLMLNIVEVLSALPLPSAWAKILSQFTCSCPRDRWCSSRDLNGRRNQTRKVIGKVSQAEGLQMQRP